MMNSIHSGAPQAGRSTVRAFAVAVTILLFTVLAPSAASAAPPSYTVTKTLTQSDPQGPRQTRNAHGPSVCGQQTTYGGLTGGSFSRQTSTFTATESGCLTVDQPFVACGAYIVLYDAALYDRNNASSGYLADPGTSPDQAGGPVSFGYTVTAGRSYVLVYYNADGAASCTTSVTFSGIALSGPEFASSNANLSNLQLSGGTLTPAFDATTTSYAATVPLSQSSVGVTPTVADSTASVKVNGSTVVSGTATTVPVNVGTNTITTVVTAQDGSTKTYTVTVTRDAGKVLTTTLAGDGRGSVTSTPAGINCANSTGAAQSACQATYDTGQQVTLTATPTDGPNGPSAFAGFTGTGTEACGTSRTCVVSLSQARNVSAMFSAPTLVAQNSLDGSGVYRATFRNADGTPAAGRQVTFSAPDQNGRVRTICTATTNAQGVASCRDPFPQIASSRPIRYTATSGGLSSSATLTYLPTSQASSRAVAARSAKATKARKAAARKAAAKKRAARAKRARIAAHRHR